jgi:hypothetical protein
MENPFQYLQDRREAEAAEEQRKEEAERLAEEQQHEERRVAADPYDGMVRRVLGFLRDARFLTEALGRPLVTRWSIGRWYPNGYFGGLRWVPSVEVQLEHNNGKPIGFACRHNFVACTEDDCTVPEVRCGLTEEELIAALQELFP